MNSIADYAFQYCSSLTAVSLPSSLARLGNYSFQYCPKLTAISVDGGNRFFSSIGGILFDKSFKQLVRYPPNVNQGGFYAIPDSVTSIGNDAFDGCSHLTSVTVPESVSRIGTDAFSACTGLTTVTFGGNRPAAAAGLFFNATPTVYFLPGTSGWESTYAGRPALLWNPTVSVTDSTFGEMNGKFGFKITGTPGITVVVEASTNLVHSAWNPISTNTLVGGVSSFSDPRSITNARSFYRFRTP